MESRRKISTAYKSIASMYHCTFIVTSKSLGFRPTLIVFY